MMDVRAIVEPRQVTQQTQPPNGPPAHKFDQPVGRIGFRRDQHSPTRVLAVVEREEQRTPFVPFLVSVAAQREGTAVQLHHADEYPKQVAQRSEGLERAVGQRRDIGGKADAQKVEGKNFAGGVVQANQINGALAIVQNRLCGSLRTVVREITQEGIASSQGKESERDTLHRFAARKHAVQDFMCRSVSAYRNKLAIALIVGFAGKL